MIDWSDLIDELDAWNAAGLTATFWWRDDDAVEPNEKLDRLLEVTATVPIALSVWPAPGSEDTELGVTMGPEVGHGEAEVHARVQA